MSERSSISIGARRREGKLRLAAGVLFLLVVTALPAGIGNVGRKNTTLSGTSLKGSSLTGTFIRVVLPDEPAITHTIIPGETAEAARDAIVSTINSTTYFVAVPFTDPADPNLAAFKVTLLGNPPDSLEIEENDSNLDDIGVRFTAGRGQTIFRKVNSAGNFVAGNGTYRLRIEALAGPDYDQTFSTAIPPNNTAAGLDASIKSSLMAAGYSVVETTTSFNVTRPGDLIVATQVDSSDTGIVVHDVSTANQSGYPSLTDYGLFGLSVMLTLLGMALLRRRTPIPLGDKRE